MLTSWAMVEMNRTTIWTYPHDIRVFVSLLRDGKSREKKEVAMALHAICSFPDNGRRVVGAALLSAAPAMGFAWWRRRKPQEQFFDIPAEEDPEVHLGQLKRFSLRESQVATDVH